MKCPYCRADTTDVFNTRPTKSGGQIWRRRRCLQCHESFTTYESVDLGFMQVTKKSGRSERYSRAKLFASLMSAFLEGKAKQSAVDAITDTIETKILDTRQAIITSEEIAALALNTLKHYHTAAFVQYLTKQTELTNEAQLRRALKQY